MNKSSHLKNKKSLPTVLVAFVIAALTLSSLSYAGGRGHHSVDFARVVKVEPILKTVEKRIPEEECWTEMRRHDNYSYEGDSYTGTILGGIIGGAIGNAVGHRKQNKRIGAAVGAILGASVGSDIASRGRVYHKPDSRYRSERRCETKYHHQYEEKVVGYHVWYRYNGEKYKTRMKHKPGKKIKVRIRVEPF